MPVRAGRCAEEKGDHKGNGKKNEGENMAAIGAILGDISGSQYEFEDVEGRDLASGGTSIASATLPIPLGLCLAAWRRNASVGPD